MLDVDIPEYKTCVL